MKTNGRDGRRGVAMVEFAMTATFLFVFTLVVFDFGMYALAFLSVQNGARAAALRNSSGIESAGDQTSACETVLEELRSLPNVGRGFTSACSGTPVVVAAEFCDGTGACGGGEGTADGRPATVVTVEYTMPVLFYQPGDGPTVIKKTVQMKVRNIT